MNLEILHNLLYAHMCFCLKIELQFDIFIP